MSTRDGPREVLDIFVQKMRENQKRVKNVFVLLFIKKGQTIFSFLIKWSKKTNQELSDFASFAVCMVIKLCK